MDPKIYRDMGLIDSEYDEIVKVLGREPTYTEIGMYAVMWSEHCGYKYSRPVLKLFPTTGKHVLQGPGENAGVVDIGDGLGLVFKIESHNHPSAVEPYQGAATGVGGIMRDIFTMGARPIASLNSLRFGELSDPHQKFLLRGVVEGIGGYGNCLGVPTVAGEIYFDDSYKGNCLVNAMGIGIVENDKVFKATAAGIGNPVMLVGARTGKDGIHGATFASVQLGPETESKRPNVQMGDPFTEKLLIEATLEALKTGYIVGIQDMGAAGITCSTCETAAKAGTGMTIDVQKVPRREEGMTPYEVMLSESQERMLCIIEKGKEDEVGKIFKKWGLNAIVIGEVTEGGTVKVYDGKELVAEVSAKSLVDECPTYEMHAEQPTYIEKVQSYDVTKLPEPKDYSDTLMKLLATPNIASKEWIVEQYDHMVQDNTVIAPGSDASVLRVKGTTKGIASTTDGNGVYSYLDPYMGGKIAVAESARNLACTGAELLGLTDCLNFGNPEVPSVFWQFRRSVEGIAEACRVFEAPVVGGNVSFYNETPEGEIYPTPVIGMVGLLDDVSKRCTQGFKAEGDTILLVGDYPTANASDLGLGGSEYLAVIHGVKKGIPPYIDLDREKAVDGVVFNAVRKGLLQSAHDCSEGGLAVAVAESCISGKLGASINLAASKESLAARLFGEKQSRIVVSVNDANLKEFLEMAKNAGVPVATLGKVGGDSLKFAEADKNIIDLKVDNVESTWRGAIGCIMS